MSDKKREYTKPEFRKWGTVEDLTAAGQTEEGDDDKFDGSVNPPGHDK